MDAPAFSAFFTSPVSCIRPTAARLRDAGVSARYLAGGIEDGKTASLPMKAK